MTPTARGAWRPLLAYSTNVHRGETLAQVYRFLREYTLPVKKLVFGSRPAGLELRLGIGSARELRKPAALDAFRGFLSESGLVPFSINAYPLRDFHSRRVKEQVYLPSWAEVERSRWTDVIARIFCEILPAGVTGTISTLGGAYRPAQHGPAVLERIAANYLSTIGTLARIEKERGRTILLAVEPEPDTTFETAADVVDFFEAHLLPAARLEWRRLSPARIEERLRRFFTVNYDTCHFSVLFQDQVASLRRLWQAGLEVGKVHVTNALALRHPGRVAAAYRELRAMDEPRYFHQFCGLDSNGGAMWRGRDLDELPPRLERNGRLRIAEIRSHYHVPVYLRKWRRLGTTRDDTSAAVREVVRAQRCRQLVIETYTWPLLEAEERLVRGIAKEFRWLMGVLEEAGVRSADSSLVA